MLHCAHTAVSSGHSTLKAGGLVLRAVQMSAAITSSKRKGCSPTARKWLCHPIVSSVSVEVDQEAYLRPSPPFHWQQLFEHTTFLSLFPPPLHSELELATPVVSTALCLQCSTFGVKKSHFNSSSTIYFLCLGLMTGAPLFFDLILSQIALELQPG